MSCEINFLKIKKGSTFSFTVSFQNENDCDSGVSLAGFTGASAYFSGVDDTVTVSGSIVSEDLGQVSFVLTPDQTNALEEGEEQSVEIEVHHGGSVLIADWQQKVRVIPRLF